MNNFEKITTELNINIEYIKRNIDIIYIEIENQIEHFKIHDKILKKRIGIRNAQYLLFLFSFGLAIFILEFVQKQLYMIALLFLCFLLVIVIYRRFYLNIMKIKQEKYKLNSKELHMTFDSDNHWYWIKTSFNYYKSPIYNIFSNVGSLYIKNKSEFIFYPNLVVKIDNKGLNIFAGYSLVNNMRYVTDVVSENVSKKYKYREFEYERWTHQRRDGGPDRRYSNNILTKYYRYHIMYILNIPFEIKSKNHFDELKQYWSFNLIRNHTLSNETTKQFSNQYQSMPIAQVAYDWKDLKSILNYLKNKNVLHNYYGETIEFEIDFKTYIIDIDGKIRNSNQNVRDIVEG